MAETGQPYAFTGDDPLNATDPLGLCVKGFGWFCSAVHKVAHVADKVRHFVAAHKRDLATAAIVVATIPLDETGAGEAIDADAISADVAADAAADTADDASTTVYRVHGGDSGPMGHSWTPEDPASMEDPRADLGLPKGNSGEFVSRATVLNTDGVVARPALPLDGNPGGAEEWLFPDPENQLNVQEIYGIDPPY